MMALNNQTALGWICLGSFLRSSPLPFLVEPLLFLSKLATSILIYTNLKAWFFPITPPGGCQDFHKTCTMFPSETNTAALKIPVHSISKFSY